MRGDDGRDGRQLSPCIRTKGLGNHTPHPNASADPSSVPCHVFHVRAAFAAPSQGAQGRLVMLKKARLAGDVRGYLALKQDLEWAWGLDS
jgi:hypothetical protein